MSRIHICILAALLGAISCQSRDGTSSKDGRDVSADPRDTITVDRTDAPDETLGGSDTRRSDTMSTDDVADTTDGSDRGVRSYIHRIASVQREFHYPIRSTYGAGRAEIERERNGIERKIPYLFLNDASDPDDIRVVDWVRFQPDTDVRSVVIDNSVLVVRQSGSREEVEARFYDIREGRFQKQFPAQKLYQTQKKARNTGPLLDLIHNGTRTVAIFEDRFVELSADPQDNAITVQQRIDRTPENQYLGKNSFFNVFGNYAMTPRGHILEVFATSVSIWTLEPDGGDALLSRTTREEGTKEWTYVPQNQHLYLANDYGNIRSEDKYEYELIIYDLSQPSDPKIVGTWHTKKDFPRTIAESFSLYSRDQRLYWTVRTDNALSGESGVYIIDLTSGPTTLDQPRFIQKFPQIDGSIDYIQSIRPFGDTAWIQYSRDGEPPPFPEVESIVVPLSTFQTSQ